MKILIIEDEPRNANRLIRLLQHIEPDAEVVGPAASVKESVSLLSSESDLDLILADIRLTDGLSFDALRQTSCNAPVIFTTAYDEYAINAFKFNSLDYLLKPINEEELAEALSKAKGISKTEQALPIAQLLEAMKQSQYKYRERFLVPFRDEFVIVPVSDISHIFTENRKVYLRLKDGTQYNVSISMDELDQQLNPQHFFRANRQYIITAECVRRISTYFSGKLMVRMNRWEDEEILISRDKVASLKEWLDK